MIDRPPLELDVRVADEFQVDGPRAQRITDFATRWVTHHPNLRPLRCRLVLRSAPPSHVGLGSGTQLALAVAAGLQRFFQLPELAPAELARSVDRGQRSAVGTYGFAHGGLIAEQGRLPHESLAPLAACVPLPEAWRFVLVRDSNATGLSGAAEREAFEALPAVPPEVTHSLKRELHERMLPAAADSDWNLFSESVFDYGVQAGSCFAACQGGPFASARIAALVSAIRQFGIPGAGQSSWGPSVFAVARDQQQAIALCDHLREMTDDSALHCEIARPCNAGAQIVAV